MKDFILHFIHTYLWWTYRPIKNKIKEVKKYFHNKKETQRLASIPHNHDGHQRIFYLGITEQPNLGDMAQHYCILNWIRENYPQAELFKFEGSVVTDSRFHFIDIFKELYASNDIIIFQSGYCTQDLGGDHPLMHRLIIDAIPDARILMMPQTIYFQKEENKKLFAENHDKACNMLFLARDAVSYEMAKEMFPHVRVEAFPDIVTTLIGRMDFAFEREGVCLCTRNDGEKFYSDAELALLEKELKKITTVTRKDTQGKASYKKIRDNLELYINDEISTYAKHLVTITDRYHGTIFSLIAGTPVIIIKTTDHKVTTGADWFKGVYDDYVHVADNLEDAYKLAKHILETPVQFRLHPHFQEYYYNNLKKIFEC